MNLNEYMVTLEKPLGIRLALSADGKIFVHAIKKGVLNSPRQASFSKAVINCTEQWTWLWQSNAEKARIIMVGDTLNKAGDSSSGGTLVEINDVGDTK